MWVDTHCHLDAPEFSSSLMGIIAAAKAKNVQAILLPAVKAVDTQHVQSLVSQYSNEIPGLAYTLGIHPLYTNQAHEDDLRLLEEEIGKALSDPRFVGIGEIGLDYFVEDLDPHQQEYYFHAQLDLAQKFQLPVILHVRRSADQLLAGLRRFEVSGRIAHAFNGSHQQARTFMELGFKLGFGGALTYNRALQLRRLAAELPLDALVLETDSPDIPPHWLYATAAQRSQGQKQGRNTPDQVPRIAQVLADLRGVSVEEVQSVTTRNVRQALGMGDDWLQASSANTPN